jgi:hypothetical protein
MKRPITIAVVAAILVTAMAAWAFAEGSFSGKVTKVDGERVTILSDGPVPAWVRAGVPVMAEGGAPRVIRVQGNEVTLKFGKEKAAKLKAEQVLKVTESSGEELQGC